ncbi:MAG: hypothetical protein ABL917_00215 [Parcubacteria group bacterium]
MGIGLVAVGAALAAGYYFYVSDNAKKNRKMVASWATSMKDEIMDKANDLKEGLNKESLMGVIDEVAKNYYMAKNVTKEDVGMVVKELKDNWSRVMEELKESKKTAQTKISKVKKKSSPEK